MDDMSVEFQHYSQAVWENKGCVLDARSSIKYLHVTLQTLVGIFIILGLSFVTTFKEFSTERHYFSMHSWIGILAIAIYFAQYCAGEGLLSCA